MRRVLFGLLVLALAPTAGMAQTPTPDQARALLQRPDLSRRVKDLVGGSGLSPAQIRARLAAAGYPESLLDAYLGGAENLPASPSDGVLRAVRALGLAGPDDLGGAAADSVPGIPGDRRTDLGPPSGEPNVFGLEVFRRVTSQFQPQTTGPVDPAYRLGPGDLLVLVLTGDVEAAYTLDVTREGFIVIPQVGQLYVAGLTMTALDNLLYSRLGRVYSGVRRGPGATTKFQASVARLRTNQIFVIGDVARPGSYQVSSAGTALTALYLAGGPTATGSFRHVEIRRGGAVVDSLDLYDYLLRGDNTHDRRLESGDVVFVPVRRIPVEVAGAVARPAIYELKPGETLSDLVQSSGGFEATALRRRIQIDRILPPAQRQAGGRDRVVLEITEDQLTAALPPAVAMAAGDRVQVFSIGERRHDAVTVRGNVWTEGRIGFTPGMRLSEAIRLAGGPKPDVFLGQILISRLNPDSTRSQLRSAFRDSTGAVTTDVALRQDDDIVVFSRTTFRPDRYIVVTGAVKRAGRIRYREGMTLRDAVLEADGLTEDALLTEAEVARMPANRINGSLATTVRVQLDSSYVFDRGPRGEYQGPPGLPAASGGAPDYQLQPYDNILILRQPDWELQRRVTLGGQVRYPGTYTLRTKTERLVDLISRAGGLTNEAYPRGAELFRRGSERTAVDLAIVGRLEAQRAGADSTGRATGGADSLRLGADLAHRVGLDLDRALRQPDSRDNLILQAGDSVFVPEFTPTIQVLGAVNAPTTVIHRQGWKLNDYVAAAGGYSRQADKARAYVVQPGGKLESINRRIILPDGRPTPLPGAVVVVPQRDPADRKDWAGLLGSIAQVLASTVAIVAIAVR